MLNSNEVFVVLTKLFCGDLFHLWPDSVYTKGKSLFPANFGHYLTQCTLVVSELVFFRVLFWSKLCRTFTAQIIGRWVFCVRFGPRSLTCVCLTFQIAHTSARFHSSSISIFPLSDFAGYDSSEEEAEFPTLGSNWATAPRQFSVFPYRRELSISSDKDEDLC